MENFNYQKICSDLISNLREREKEIIIRRFGLNGKNRETLEAIGCDFGICRERVRQIQESALNKIKEKIDQYQELFEEFLNYFKDFGKLRKEETLLNDLGKGKFKNEVYFLLNQKEIFQRRNEDEKFYSFWFVDKEAVKSLEKVFDSLYNQFQEIGKPLKFKDLKFPIPLKEKVALSYLEIFKEIQKNEEGFYGLISWPEIKPRGIRDKAYLVFKKIGKPLHFTQVANLIEGSHLQTVHNELIRDERFVLIGRGIYALREWGYWPGQVKDIILKILKEAKRPLKKEEILERVKKQRVVKETTIFLNLSDKNYFQRDKKGRYLPKTALI